MKKLLSLSGSVVIMFALLVLPALGSQGVAGSGFDQERSDICASKTLDLTHNQVVIAKEGSGNGNSDGPGFGGFGPGDGEGDGDCDGDGDGPGPGPGSGNGDGDGDGDCDGSGDGPDGP